MYTYMYSKIGAKSLCGRSEGQSKKKRSFGLSRNHPDGPWEPGNLGTRHYYCLIETTQFGLATPLRDAGVFAGI